VNYSYLCGERVTEERQRLGLSQADAGALCGVSREMWGKYERGKAVMGTEVLSRFALNGADALYILTGQRNAATPALKPDEAALLDNYRHAPKEQQEILRATSAAFANKPTATKASKDVKIGGKGHRFALGDYHENK